MTTTRTPVPPREELDRGARGPKAVALTLLGYRSSGIFIALVILVATLCVISPSFRDPFNLTILTKQMAVVTIMATGQTLVIISGAFDLSQSAVCGLAAIVSGTLWAHAGLHPIIAIVLALATGTAAGITNGILAARFKLHPIVMTLATSTMFTGVTYVVTHGQPVIGLPPQLLWMGSESVGPFAISVLLMVTVVAVMQILLNRTLFGLRVRQMGGNIEAARLTGVNVRRVWLGVFAISATLSALGGLIELGRVGNAIPTIGVTLLFPIITASILGGTLLSGGEGSMIGTMLGAAVLTVINNALVILQVDVYLQSIVQGGLVVVALIVDQFRRRQLTLRDLIRPEL